MLTPDEIAHITERIAHAHAEHGRFNSSMHFHEAINDELDEVWQATDYESLSRVIEELFDVAVVAIRYAQQLKTDNIEWGAGSYD